MVLRNGINRIAFENIDIEQLSYADLQEIKNQLKGNLRVVKDRIADMEMNPKCDVQMMGWITGRMRYSEWAQGETEEQPVELPTIQNMDQCVIELANMVQEVAKHTQADANIFYEFLKKHEAKLKELEDKMRDKHESKIKELEDRINSQELQMASVRNELIQARGRR